MLVKKSYRLALLQLELLLFQKKLYKYGNENSQIQI